MPLQIVSHESCPFAEMASDMLLYCLADCEGTQSHVTRRYTRLALEFSVPTSQDDSANMTIASVLPDSRFFLFQIRKHGAEETLDKVVLRRLLRFPVTQCLINDQPHLVDNQPHLVNDQPHLVDNQSHLVNDQPHLVDNQPFLSTTSQPFLSTTSPSCRQPATAYVEQQFGTADNSTLR